MVEVYRKDRESVGSLLRRFSRRIQQSGTLREARKNRFLRSKATRHARRISALRRERVKALRERLVKLGLLEEQKEVPQDLIRKYLRTDKLPL